ncbi:MAG: UPF0149 family protein [Pontibacterium sp.]
MSSELNNPPELPDFDLLANLLVEEGAQLISPSELHGLFSGHLAAGVRLEPSALLQSACDLMDINSLGQEAGKVMLTELYQQSLHMLEADELIFELLMPDDDVSLAQRAEGLGHWCQGFLAGFGLHGKQTDKTLSKEAKEALSDLNQIAQIVADDDDPEGESDLMQVEEYVRMVVLMLFSECNTAARPSNDSQPTVVH